ncbi:hypothetical protein H8959_017044 [Pygathrix nigripes]
MSGSGKTQCQTLKGQLTPRVSFLPSCPGQPSNHSLLPLDCIDPTQTTVLLSLTGRPPYTQQPVPEGFCVSESRSARLPAILTSPLLPANKIEPSNQVIDS